MAIIISQIKTTLDEPKDNAVAKALSLLRLSRAETASAKLYKSSVDARRDICFVNSVYIAMKDPAKERRLAEKHQNVRLYEPGALSFTRGKERLRGDVYVAGFGPAGMFCALTLCEFGYRPVVLERGADMDSRIRAVEGFWAGGALDPSTNVQFGEGGANALAWMQRLGTRMKLWHINDRGTRISGSAVTPILKTDSMELGTGNMDLDSLMAQALSVGVDAVILESHRNWVDNSPIKSLQVSAEYLKKHT